MSINTNSVQVSTPSFPLNFIPYGQVVPNQRQLIEERIEIAESLFNLDPQNPVTTSLDSLQSHSFTQIASGIPQESETSQLSQEEQAQIWVSEPKVTMDAQRNVKKVVVKKNSKDWVEALYVEDIIVKSTPKDYIADGENTEFYDEEGNFICGIVYGVEVEEKAIQKLAPLACSTPQRGPAAGLIPNIEELKESLRSQGYNYIKVVGEGWALRAKKQEGKGTYSTFANRHYSTTYGVTGSGKSKTVDSTAETKKSGLQTLQPYFQKLTGHFMTRFTAQCYSHMKAMERCGGTLFYQPRALFSSMVINRHEITETGEEAKNSRPAIHVDEGHHPDAFEVMLTLKDNIEGGDLYLPEYGILLKVKDRSVTCFKATLLKHTVTKIGREDISKKASRVTAVAFMHNFTDTALKQAKENFLDRMISNVTQRTGIQPATSVLPQPVLTTSPYSIPSQPQVTVQQAAGLVKMLHESQALIQQLKAANQLLSLEKQVVESKLETANLRITVLTEKLLRTEPLTNQKLPTAIPQSNADQGDEGVHRNLTNVTTTTDTGSSFTSFKRGQSELNQGDDSLMEPVFKRPRVEKQ